MENGYLVAFSLYEIVSVQIISVMHYVFFGNILIIECFKGVKHPAGIMGKN